MPTKEEIQAALRVLEAATHPPSLEDIRSDNTPEEIAAILKAVREAGGVLARPDNEPTLVSAEDKKIHALMTRDKRLEPLTVDEQKILAAATVKAYREAGVEIRG
jgi:hypothetical protein